MKAITVLVVDRTRLMREGLKGMLQNVGVAEIVGEAEDGLDALNREDGRAPDVVLMGSDPPNVDCLDMIRKMKLKWPATSLILLSSSFSDSDPLITEAIQAGASGFLPLDLSCELLGNAIEAAGFGCAVVKLSLLQRFAAAGIFMASRARNAGQAQSLQDGNPLTGREQEVLRLLVAGNSNKEIGAALLITEETVKKHVRSILVKLHASDRTDAAVKAVRSGLAD